MNYLKGRMREPSTWAALGALVAIFGGRHAGQYADLVAALGGLAMGAGAVLPEGPK